jgi:hypothetical protein
LCSDQGTAVSLGAVASAKAASPPLGALERRPSLNFIESKTRRRCITTEKTYFT